MVRLWEQRTLRKLVEEIEEVITAYCYLVSQTGQPVARPQIIDVQLQMSENQPSKSSKGA